VFYSVIETRDFSLFNQSTQALLKGYFIITNINSGRLLQKFTLGWHFFYASCQLGFSSRLNIAVGEQDCMQLFQLRLHVPEQSGKVEYKRKRLAGNR
jgi:hypothetical protein